MNPQVIFLVLVALAPMLGLIPLIRGWQHLNAFLKRMPRLATEADLREFKALARRQMILALVQFGVLASPWAVFALGLATGNLTLSDSVFSVGACAVVLAVGLAMHFVEKRAQSLPTDTPELAQARDAVVKTWRRKALPDWAD